MNSPKLFLKKTIFQAQYKMRLKYYSLLLSAASNLEEEGFPHWETDGLSVVLKDQKNQSSVSIAANSFTYSQDLGDEELAQKNIETLLTKLPESLAVKSYIRLGYRKQFLIALDMQFQELVRILRIKLFTEDESLAEILPQQLDTFGFRMIFQEGENKFNMLLAPTAKGELPPLNQLLNLSHLPEKNQEEIQEEFQNKIYKKILKSYPDVVLSMDIDVYREGADIPLADAAAFVKDARSRIGSIVDNWKSYLFTTALGGKKNG